MNEHMNNHHLSHANSFLFFVAFHQNTFCEFMFAEMLQFEIFITIPIWFQYQGQCVCV